MSDTRALVKRLLAEAEDREAEAQRLRDAAAILSGGTASPSPRTNGSGVRAADGRFRGVPMDTYITVMEDRGPMRHWSAPDLADAMSAAGHKIEMETARTMLYRMAKRGMAKKVGRGEWVLTAADKPSNAQRQLDAAIEGG